MPGLEFEGIRVHSCISSLVRTLSGSYGTRPALVKLPYIFVSVIEAKNASWNADKNSSLLM